jgi:SAM-dependent methyltransferase/uncharacterized protein YbaR (Trm112 family)
MIPHRSILASSVRAALRCPRCTSQVEARANELHCTRPGCAASYPVVDGIPVLVDSERSAFRVEDIAESVASDSGNGVAARSAVPLRRRLLQRLPPLGRNLRAKENLAALHSALPHDGRERVVLIIGGATPGVGTEQLTSDETCDVVESDVYIGARTNLVCDAHVIPLADGTVDAVIMQAVVNALSEPERAIAEIYRVLRPQGLVYVEAPFMQQVCEGSFDYYRFSHLGLRRLLRNFDEMRSGAQGGPGMAAALAYQHLLLSLAPNRAFRALSVVFARLTAFWLPLLDRWLVDRPGAVDAAAGVFFLGRRSDTTLTESEIRASYRGWRQYSSRQYVTSRSA